ncbi:MAG: GNAT family N-acetyltransferase [bacterium]|nr:GNAT family N-acetyltransferase [bacterium]
MIIRGELVNLRDTIPTDLIDHQRWCEPGQEWMNWDAPWEMSDRLNAEALAKRLERLAGPPADPRTLMEIETVAGRHIGWLGTYWISKVGRWRDCGIVIAEEDELGQGLGREALTLWIDYLLAAHDLPRIGIGTWSGNTRMIRLAEAIGLEQEACFRDAREHNGRRYDAVRWGITRSAWEQLRQNDRLR